MLTDPHYATCVRGCPHYTGGHRLHDELRLRRWLRWFSAPTRRRRRGGDGCRPVPRWRWLGAYTIGRPWLLRLRFRWPPARDLAYVAGRPLRDVVFGVMLPFVSARPEPGCGCFELAKGLVDTWRSHRRRTAARKRGHP